MNRQAMQWQPGDKLLVHGAWVGSCTATVLTIDTPDHLPPIQGAPPVAEVKEIMQELQVDTVMSIEFTHHRGVKGKIDLACLLLHTPTGWYDLQQQPIIIAGISDDPPLLA